MKLNSRYGALSQAERDEFPTITVAGQTCIIPPLAPRQNRRIIPKMSRIGVIDFNKLDESSLDDLYGIIYWALTRAYEIAENDFMDMEIPLTEIMPAVVVITQQTGLATLRQPGEEPGEAKATGTTSIGTSSSPDSAQQQDGDGTTQKTSSSEESKPSSTTGKTLLQ